MLTLSFSKILMTVLVIVVVWRGYRMYLQLQSRLAATSAHPTPPSAAPKATDLVECPRCGLFVPNGTICRSVEQCQFRRG